MNGVLILDKPPGLTSHDAVNRVRRILQQKSVGHLGTLDPMATGVLPLVLGNLTRLAQFYISCEKTYAGTIRFGFATDTYDAEGVASTEPQAASVSLEQARELAGGFRGVIEQVPPPYSAKKVDGIAAYKLARKKQEVTLRAVQVEIKEFDILSADGDRITFNARVASGTYMRSVAHDMGRKLGCGAHLEILRRTSVGEFTCADAHTLEQVEDAIRLRGSEARGSNEIFIHPRKLLPQFPSVTADEETASRIRSGRSVNLMDLSKSPQVKVFAGQRELIAIATRIAGTLFHPKIVLAPELASVT